VRVAYPNVDEHDARMGHPGVFDASLNARSLHSTDHRFAMICSGRDDRVGEI